MGKFRPKERSPRSESMKVIVEVFGWGQRVAKKVRRRWKAPCADILCFLFLRECSVDFRSLSFDVLVEKVQLTELDWLFSYDG